MTTPLDLTALARETRTFGCEYCHGTGHRYVHAPSWDDPDYEHETNEPCGACYGHGAVEIDVEPIEMEDLP